MNSQDFQDTLKKLDRILTEGVTPPSRSNFKHWVDSKDPSKTFGHYLKIGLGNHEEEDDHDSPGEGSPDADLKDKNGNVIKRADGSVVKYSHFKNKKAKDDERNF